MQLIPESVARLIEEFGKLPGVGPRSAERLTFFLLRGDKMQSENLAEAIARLHAGVKSCTTCFNLSESDTCAVCSNPGRERDIIAVVEEPLDVIAIEKTGLYRGLYHVLGGVISPIDGMGPERLKIKELIQRTESGNIKEIILATNPVTEGETTAMYIRRALENLPVSVTRLARGLPVGGDLEYADQITLGRALQGRQSF